MKNLWKIASSISMHKKSIREFVAILTQMKHIYVTSIFILIIIAGYGQTKDITKTGVSFTLDQPLDPDDVFDYTATEFVNLTGDFGYEPYSGNWFHAISDPLMVIPPGEGETGGPNPDDDGVVGTTGGSFQVSNTGQATYTIPLEFPGGVAGMTPDLSLVYNSGGKDGIFGPGWSLSGLSVISQVPANRYYDGIYDAAKGGDYKSEAYMLNGQRLIVYSKEGIGDEKVIFRKEQDDFSRITRKTLSSEDVNVYRFTVQTMSGLTYNYGESVDSRQTVQIEDDITICLSYYVNRIVDNFGNEINFFYSGNERSETSEIYLSRIEYTTTHDGGPIYSINFNYTKRGFPYTTYYNYQPANDNNQSIAVISDSIVDYIECRYIEGDANNYVKKYDLEYTYRGPGTDNANRLAHLSSVQEFGLEDETGEPIKYNKTVFEWEEENYTTNLIEYSLPSIVFNDNEPQKFFVDINNDSQNELIVAGLYQPTIFDYAVKVYILTAVNTGNGVEYEILETLTFEPDDIVYDENKIWYQIHFGDYDGDGNTEMLFSLNWVEHYHDDWYRTKISMLSFDSEITTSDILSEEYWYTTYSADFNGDGISDLLLQKFPDGNLTWKLGDPEEPLASNQDKNEDGDIILTYDPPELTSDEPFKILDANGDGRADILANGMLNLLVPDGAQIKWSSESFEDYNATFCNLNHDRKIDGIKASGLYASTSSNCNSDILAGFQVNFYNGTGQELVPNGEAQTFEVTLPMPTLPSNISDCEGQGTSAEILNIADFSGDGLSDFLLKVEATVAFRNDTYNQTGIGTSHKFYYLITSPTGEKVTLYNASGGNNYIAAELTGDFQTDLVGFSDDNIIVLSPQYNGNCISKITNGLGTETKIEYAFSDDEEVYGFDPDAEYDFPLIPYNASKKLVKTVERSNGRGGYYSKGYYYEDAVAHTEGLGFIGFGAVTITDNDQAMKYKTSYDINDTYYFSYPVWSNKMTLGEQLIQQTVNFFSCKEFDGFYDGQHYYFPKKVSNSTGYFNLSDETQYKFELTLYQNYDDYGFPETIINKKGISVYNLTHETSITHVYQHFTTDDHWILGRLTEAEAVSSAPNAANITRKSAFTYYDDGADDSYGMLKQEITEPDNNEKKVTKSYTYDEYGNILTTTYSVVDASIEERTNETTYSANGRFIDTLINALSHKTTRQYDEVLGMLETETDVDNNLTTTFYYDGFGHLSTTIAPTGNKSVVVLRWVQDGDSKAPPNAVYYSWAQSSGSSPVWVYYDCKGMELRAVKKGFDLRYIYVDTYYNTKGQVDRKTEPYFVNDPVFETVYDQYDILGRVETVIHPDDTESTFTYDGLTTTMTNQLEQTSTKTLNAAGWLIRSTDDNNQAVLHSYYSNGKVDSTMIENYENTKRKYYYDIVGNLIKYTDASLGTIEREYNAFGEITLETNPKGATQFTEYDKLGRLREKVSPEGTTTWVYDQQKAGMLDYVRLINTEGIQAHKLVYNYDQYLRTEMISESIFDEDFYQSYSYNVLSRLKTYTYPTGYQIENRYNSMGYLGKIVSKYEKKVLWEATVMNARDQYETVHLGGNIQQQWEYYAETGRTYKISSPGLQANEYGWDDIGNLNYRKTLSSSFTESFGYDDHLNRLEFVKHNGIEHLSMTYDELGNITKKSDVGNYEYVNTDNPYELTGIDNKPPTINDNQIIDYNSFNKVSSIVEKNPDTYQIVRELYLNYGVGNQRIKQVYQEAGSLEETKLYVGGNFEKSTVDGVSKWVHYIYSPQGLAAILTRNESGEDVLNYVLTDHLGSVQLLADAQGNLLEEYSYDAWGLRRDPVTLEVFVPDPQTESDYGFTGHEHLDAFKLINMNGRMYDPVIARFLSPDPVLQFPHYTQGLNPYSYTLNNPLRFTDPSGYSLVGNLIALGVSIALAPMPMLAILAYSVVMTIDYAIENGRNANIGDIGKYFAQTFAMSMASMGTSKVIGDVFKHTAGSIWNELGRAAAHGLTNGAMRMIQGGKFEHGFLSGFVSSLGGSFMQAYGGNMRFETQVALSAALGGTAEAIGGGKFANGAVTGAYVMMFNHLWEQGQVEKFQKKYFGQVKGLNKIFTNAVPDGYSLDPESGMFKNNEGALAGAITDYLGDGLSDVYLSPYALGNGPTLYSILGHEMIHVAHHNYFLDTFDKGASEYAAYMWNFNTGSQLFSSYPTSFEKVIPRDYLHSGLKAYKYEKFGFNSKVLSSVWIW